MPVPATLPVSDVAVAERDSMTDTIELHPTFREEPAAPVALPPDYDGPPLLDLPESRLPHDASAEERHVNFVMRLLFAVGGSATYAELYDRVPQAMNRTPGDTHRSGPTPLDVALRRAVTNNTVAVEPGREVTYHLTNSGAILLGMPPQERGDLADLTAHVDQLRTWLADYIAGRTGTWAREDYNGIIYKIAEIEAAAGLAATRAGVVAHRHHFAERVDIAFHDLTRGR